MPDVANGTGKHRPKRRHHGEGSRPFRVDDARRQRPWRCALRLGRDPITGRYRQKWFSGTSAVDVEQQRDEYVRRLRLAGSQDAVEMTVAVFLREWFARRKAVDPSTRERYEGIIERSLVPSLGHLAVAELTYRHVEAAADSWRTVRGAPLSAASFNLTLGLLREAMQLAVRRGLLETDPTAEIARDHKPASVGRYLEADEAQRLIDALRGDYLEPIVTIALAVGPRRGEILGMRWSEINLDRAEWRMGLQLRRIPIASRGAEEGPYRLVPPKSEHGMGRVIILPSFVVDALRAHGAEWEVRRRDAKVWVKPGDLVFCDDMGQALPPNSVTRRFQTLAERAGLGHLRLHDMRHSAGTILLAMGVSERVIQEMFGHASPQQTRQYAKVVRRLGEDAAERMDKAFAR